MTEIALPEMPSEVSETIAYHHRVPWLIDMTYTLHSDRVVATGSRIWVPKLEAVIWLRTLSANTTVVWMRTAHFQWAVTVAICIAAVHFVFLPFAGLAFGWIVGFGLLLLIPALAYAYRSRKLIRYTHFVTKEGVNILSVGDAGPDIERYESFVQELLRRIPAQSVS
jgi:hypothetical protein